MIYAYQHNFEDCAVPLAGARYLNCHFGNVTWANDPDDDTVLRECAFKDCLPPPYFDRVEFKNWVLDREPWFGSPQQKAWDNLYDKPNTNMIPCPECGAQWWIPAEDEGPKWKCHDCGHRQAERWPSRVNT